MEYPSDAQLFAASNAYLDAHSMEETSLKMLMGHLEQQFQVDLNERKNNIRMHLENRLLAAQPYGAEAKMGELNQMVAPQLIEEPPKKKPNGFTRLLKLSHEMGSFLGGEYAPRPEVTKRLWAHIKANNLQDQNDKRFIVCDSHLKRIFNMDHFSMFQMSKLLNEHFTVIEDHSLVNDSNTLHITESNNNNPPKKRKVKKIEEGGKSWQEEKRSRRRWRSKRWMFEEICYITTTCSTHRM